MLKRLFKRLRLDPIYLQELSISYQDNSLTITNFGSLLALFDDKIILSKALIYGKSLKISYLSEHIIIIKGFINNVERVEEKNEL